MMNFSTLSDPERDKINEMRFSKKLLSISVFSILAFSLLSHSLVFASGEGVTPDDGDGESGTPLPTITITNPLSDPSTNNLVDFIRVVVNDILLPIGGVVVAIAIIYTGFLFVVSRGNEEKLRTAKRAFLYTTIGTAVLLGAWTITLVIKATIDSITTAS
jgi:hypothetical protein